MRLGRWRGGNDLRLLENGEAFFPRVFEAINRARREVVVETFILEDDAVGRRLHHALRAAARRGVRTTLTVDGYGSAPLPPHFVRELTRAGVRVDVFDPRRRLFGWRLNLFRRLHRKIVVVDGERAFVGGINFTHEHLQAPGEPPKQDYAVEIVGPVVQDIHALATHEGQWVPLQRRPRRAHAGRRHKPPAHVMFAVRDNERHPNDIELQYRIAIRRARRRIVIANAYFFPGYRILRDLTEAAQRGVEVHLIMQGQPDKPIVRWATSMMYDDLRRAGICLHEFRGPLHAKVAVIDDDWSTVGSSNLDPLSLFLNLEANVVIRDREFARHLEEHLMRLIDTECEAILAGPRRARVWRRVLAAIAYHGARRFPRWAGWLPGRMTSFPQAVRAHVAPPMIEVPSLRIARKGNARAQRRAQARALSRQDRP